MGLFQLLGFVVIVVLACSATVWILAQLAPTHPIIIDRCVWVLAVVLVVLAIAYALGLHDVMIPRIAK